MNEVFGMSRYVDTPLRLRKHVLSCEARASVLSCVGDLTIVTRGTACRRSGSGISSLFHLLPFGVLDWGDASMPCDVLDQGACPQTCGDEDVGIMVNLHTLKILACTVLEARALRGQRKCLLASFTISAPLGRWQQPQVVLSMFLRT